MASVITALHAQRRHPERANLHVDGEFCCGIAYELVLTERLHVGDVITAGTLDRVRAADERWRAKQATLTLLATRQRTRRELVTRLRRKGFSDGATEWALGEAERLGLLDDVAFAEAWVRDRLRLRPRGSRALESELVRKGVNQQSAREIVARVMRAQSAGDAELCLAAAEKWMRTNGRRFANADAEERRRIERRLAGFLGRRGYGGEDVRAAVRSVAGRSG